jgi:ABC-2 type transport system permease protein
MQMINKFLSSFIKFWQRQFGRFLDWPRLILSLAFVRKELFGNLRQPRLLLSLVVGPFLTLALFGLGYHGPGRYNTILVVPDEEGISTNVADYREVIKETFNLIEVTKNEAEARATLRKGGADVVIVVPGNALDEIYNGRHARFPVYYRSLSPVDSSYIEYSTYVYASEFDKVILRQALAASKPQPSQIQDASEQLDASTNQLDQSMREGNIIEAKIQVRSMKSIVQLTRKSLDTLILPGEGTTGSAQGKLLGGRLARVLFQSGVLQLQSDLNEIERNLDALDAGFNRGDLNSPEQRARLENIRRANASLSERTNKLAAIPPSVIVEPVLSAADNEVVTKVNYINFYGSAVVILLLQHIGVTLASLSNVRDRMIGAIEIFRVAPINPTQILTGKFVSYTLLLLSLGLLLIGLITQLLGVPFVDFGGRWPLALLTLFLTIYASIGLGYLVAGLSRTESQAVQLTMLLLLATIFFTGFILPLNQFENYIRYLSYILPITFGANSLQNIMLDSQPLNLLNLLILFGLGSFYLLLGRYFYQRQFNIN